MLFLDRAGREPTERVQAQRIRCYLGLSRFDAAAEASLRAWLREGALEGRTAPELLARVEARKTLLDQIVEMNDLFLSTMNRRARNSVEKQRKGLRRRARDGLHRVLGAVDALVAADGAQIVSVFRDAQNPPALIEAAIACRA